VLKQKLELMGQAIKHVAPSDAYTDSWPGHCVAVREIRYNLIIHVSDIARTRRGGAVPALRTEERDLLTVPEVARLLRVAESTVRKWVGAGRVPFLELPGGEYRIPRTELVRGLRGNVDVEKVLGRVESRLQRLTDREIEESLASVRKAKPRRPV